MRRSTMRVFDDWVPDDGVARYTSADLNERLGLYDALSVHAQVEATTDGLFTVRIEHSADGRNWIVKPPGWLIDNDLGPGTWSWWGRENGSLPNLRFVRLSIINDNWGYGVPVRAKIDVIARDAR